MSWSAWGAAALALVLSAGCAELLSLDYGSGGGDGGGAASSSTAAGGAGGGGASVAMPPTVMLVQPADGAVGPPTRRLLGWTADDPDGDALVFDVYFDELLGQAFDRPYRSGVTALEFVVQASTDGRAEYGPESGMAALFLAPATVYRWKICARDGVHETCSEERTFGTDQSVVGWWRFDEDPASSSCGAVRVCDASGRGHHGTVSGLGWTFHQGRPDLLGGALEFPGLQQQELVTVSLGGGAALNPSSITVQARVALQQTPGHNQTIVDRRGGGAHGYQLEIANDTKNAVFGVTQASDDYGETVDWLNKFAPDRPQVVTGRWDYAGSCNGLLSLFIDGEASPNTREAAVCHDNPGTGAPIMGDNLFVSAPEGALRGLVDELIVYDRALTHAEVFEAYRTSTLGLELRP